MPNPHRGRSSDGLGTERARARIDALQRLSLDLAAAQSIDQVTAAVVDHAVTDTGAAGAALWLLSAGGLAAAAAAAGTLADVVLPSPDLAGLYSGDVRAARPWLTGDLAAALRTHGASRTRAATLYAGGQAIGALVLIFGGAHAHENRDDDAAMLGAIVRPAAEAIARARGVAEALQLAAIVESTDDAIVAVTPEQEIFAWNPGAERLFGHSAAEAIGGNLSILIDGGSDDSNVADMLERLRVGGGSERIEAERVRKDGARLALALTCSPMRDGQGRLVGVALAARDITESTRLAEELRRAQRLEALGRLAGGVAHDFNNLLTVIMGCLELARMQPQPSDYDELIAEALTASTSAKELTGQLLSFARAQPVAPVSLELQATAKAMLPMLRRLIGSDIRLTLDADAGTAPVLADPSQVEQIIMNLVLNARDALSGRGEISVTIRPDASEDAVRMTIADNGHGIPPEVLARLFEPFFTTKGEGQGTGLGLATVHGAVTQAGGTITVESEPGAGTRFTVQLPVAPEHSVPGDAIATSAVVHGRGGTQTVLVCDDEDAVLSVTTRILERSGYHVLATSDPIEALESAASGRSIDVLITDVRMPRMSGPQLAQQIVEGRPGLPVLFISGYTAGLLDPGTRAGASAFLAKPFTPQGLLAAVHRLLQHTEAT